MKNKMKNIHLIYITLVMLIGTACNDEFLDRTPETSIGKENFFNSEADLNLYINGLYNFPGWFMFLGDLATDNASTTGNTELKTMMTTEPSSATITGGWNWNALRSINFFLENFGKADISQEKLDHFEGLARFFRAQFYIGMVKRYSDVPYYDFVIETDNEDALFKARDPRSFVVDRIFEDYAFAADHVLADQPAGAVNKWVVKTYMARAALYEGTFRKYHDELNLQGSANQFLEMARDISQEIINSGNYSIYNTGNSETDYSSLFTNADLTSNSEIILANISISNLKNSNSSATIWGDYEVSPSKDLLQAYLMKDGSYYTQQAGYESKLFVEEFADRDPRLSQTYAAPGFILRRVDTYTTGTGLYVQRLAKNFSGYHQRKGMVNVDDPIAVNDVDIPVLRYAEVLLTLAEAQAELGTISQSDIDNTINVLRARAGIPPLTLDVTADPVQQARYPGISSPVLLEIRRERRIELALEGFRFDDLMRWKAGKLLEAEPEGLYFPSLGKYDLNGDGIDDIILIDASETVPGAGEKEQNSLGQDLIYYRASKQGGDANVYLENGNSGTVQTVAERGTFMEPKYYYRPIPETHVIINPNLTQLFGWN